MNLIATVLMFLFTLPGHLSGYQAGNKIENFTLTNVVTNESVSLSDYANEKGVVMVFTSNYCPYSKLYEDRILGLAKQYEAQGIKFLLINSNTATDNVDESVAEMAKHAKEKGLQIPYLADKEGRVSTKFGATKNPEAFVLQNNGGIFILKYRGAIDNNPQVPNAATAFYLKDAVLAVVNKKNLGMLEKRPIGCMIRKD